MLSAKEVPIVFMLILTQIVSTYFLENDKDEISIISAQEADTYCI